MHAAASQRPAPERGRTQRKAVVHQLRRVPAEAEPWPGANLAYRSLVLGTLAAAWLANYFADVALQIASLRSLLVFV